jgi:hypothetical protein
LPIVAVVAALLPILAACSSEPTLSQEQVLARIEGAGMQIQPFDRVEVSDRQLQRLGVETDVMHTFRISDGQGNSEVVTLVRYPGSKQAERVDDINGFAARNVFFVGTISTYFREKIVSALS